MRKNAESKENKTVMFLSLEGEVIVKSVAFGVSKLQDRISESTQRFCLEFVV